jgi:hypothetical protein
LQTRLEYRRPTPLILVKAYMTFCLPALVRGRTRGEMAERKRTIDVGVEQTQLSRNQHSCPENRVIQPTMNWKFALSPGTSDILAVVRLVEISSIPLRGDFEPDGRVQGGSTLRRKMVCPTPRMSHVRRRSVRMIVARPRSRKQLAPVARSTSRTNLTIQPSFIYLIAQTIRADDDLAILFRNLWGRATQCLIPSRI